jgi:hypothetical protein
MFLAARAKRTVRPATANPGIYNSSLTDCDVAGVISDCGDLADNFMPGSEWQILVALSDLGLSPVPEIKIAVGDMEIAVAYTAT